MASKKMAYCFSCKKKVPLEKDTKIIKRKLPNGNTSTILCGKCSYCDTTSCTIIANSKK